MLNVMHFYEHVLNGNCFSGLGSACRALSAHHTPQQLGTKLIDDIDLLLNDPFIMEPDRRDSKLRAFSAALGLSQHTVGRILPLSEVEEYLRIWSSCFFTCSDVDDIVLCAHQFSAIPILLQCRAHSVLIPPTMSIDSMRAALIRHIEPAIFTKILRMHDMA